MTVAHFPPPSPQQMLDEVERELAMRRQVYPRQVASRQLRQQTADYRIHVMEAVASAIRKAIERKTETANGPQA